MGLGTIYEMLCHGPQHLKIVPYPQFHTFACMIDIDYEESEPS